MGFTRGLILDTTSYKWLGPSPSWCWLSPRAWRSPVQLAAMPSLQTNSNQSGNYSLTLSLPLLPLPGWAIKIVDSCEAPSCAARTGASDCGAAVQCIVGRGRARPRGVLHRTHPRVNPSINQSIIRRALNAAARQWRAPPCLYMHLMWLPNRRLDLISPDDAGLQWLRSGCGTELRARGLAGACPDENGNIPCGTMLREHLIVSLANAPNQY